MFVDIRSTGPATLRFGAATLVIGLATFVTVLPAQGAGASDDVVSTCAGSGPGSLPAVVAAASSGDTIDFSVSCPPSSPITLASTIHINTNLTIDGPGASDVAVSGNHSVGVFDVSGSVTASFSDLTIENGNAPSGSGGGISNNSGTLSVTNSILTGNTALYGGGIYSAGTATVTDSTMSNDSAVYGGALENDYGGTFYVTNSTLSSNMAIVTSDNPVGYGGAILNGVGPMTVTNSTLSGNRATIGGGLINEGGNLTVTDSTLSDNNANGGSGGGGIANNDAGTLVVTDSTLSGNSAATYGGGISSYDPTTVTSSTLSGNRAATAGGGIWSGGGTVDIAASIVTNNNSGNDCGGAIADNGYNLDDDGSCGFSAGNGSESGVDPDLGPLQNNGGPTETLAPELGSPVLNRIPLGTTGNGMTLCPGTDQRGVPRPQGSECDIGAVELVIPKAITSPNSATATVGSPFTFTVTTSGSPVPKITEKVTLPKKLTFTDNGNGTATISGKPKKAGVSHLTITATFGSGSNKYVVSQAFTLTVDSG